MPELVEALLGGRAQQPPAGAEHAGDRHPCPPGPLGVAGQRFVVDNTNPTPAERRRYVEPARAAGFRVVGYLVEVDPAQALARNAERPAGKRVPVAGVVGTGRRLVRPTLEEGFDELWHATAARSGGWRIEPLLVTPPLF